MANKNEAKIKFTAETGEFNDQIKKANNEMSQLRGELKLNEEQMKTTGETVEGLEKKHALLESQLKASQSKTEALNAKIEKATEIFGEDSQEVMKLKTQLTNAQIAEEKIKQAIEKCNGALDGQAEAIERVETYTEKMNAEMEGQQDELNKLKREYTEWLMQGIDPSCDNMQELAGKIEKTSRELKENKDTVAEAKRKTDEFDRTLDKAEDSVDDLGDAAKETDNDLEKLGDTSDNVGIKLGDLAVGVAAVGAAMIAAGKEAIEAFNEVDDGADNVIKATGATGEAAAELEESYKNVASSIVGDFGNIGSTLGEVNTRFGFTGSEAEKATEQFLKFSEVTGMDAVTAVQDVSRAIESAGLDTSDYGAILDALTTAGQATGVSVETLASSLTDNGAVMREMGYDTQTTIAMLAQFEKAGVDSNSVVRGMRTAISKWSKDGLDAKTEFSKLVTGIKDGSVSAGEAYEAFGSKAGGELVDAIKSGRFEYEDMIAVIEGSEGSLDNTFDATIDGGYELELAMQNAKMALAEAGGELGTALIPAFQSFSQNILPAATKAIGAMVDGISSAVGWMKEHKALMVVIASVVGVLTTAIIAYNVVQGIKNAMDAANVTTVWALVSAHVAQAAAAMAAIAPYVLIVAAIAAVIAIIVLCVKHWDKIVAAVKKALSAMGKFFADLWQKIKSLFAPVAEWFGNLFTKAKERVMNAWSSVTGFFSKIWSGTKAVFSNVGSWFREKFSAAKDGVKNAWSSVTSFFSGIFSKIKNTFAKVKDAILSPFRTAIDKVKGLFNSLKLKFPNIKLPHFSVKPKGWKIGDLLQGSIPKLGIEWYSKAMSNPMVLNGATIFGQANGKLLGGGEAGSEMIGGTNTIMRMIQSAVDRSIRAYDMQSLTNAVEDLANRPIELNINGRQFALATAGDSDNVNGLRSTFKSRGLILD